MGIIRIKPTWARKPPTGVQRDSGHPLSLGMIYGYVFDEGAGLPMTESGNNRQDASLTATAWITGPDGPALSATGVTGKFYAPSLVDLGTATGTVVWRMLPAFSPTDGVTHYMWGTFAAGGEFGAQKFFDNNWYVGWNFSVDRRVTFAAATANLTQDVWQHYAFTWSSAGSFLYRNGLQIGTNGTGPTVGAVSGFGWLRPDNDGGVNGIGAGSAIDLALVYNRVLSISDIQWSFQEPFAFMKPPKYREYFFVEPAAAAGDAVPAVWSQYRRRFAG